MKYYMVKTISKSTDMNKNFANTIQIGYYGKNQKLLGCYSTPEDPWIDFDFRTWMLEDYGYTRECDARRSWIYKNPENTEFWTTSVEVVSIEV